MAVKWTLENVMRVSDLYYNMGLEKAQAKDYTAAVKDLRRAVRLNGQNINARNLLGLIYYQTGEFAEALTQWLVSDTLKKDDNPASYFLEQIQQNEEELRSVENALIYFNRATRMVDEGRGDLAILQLRKAINVYPSFLKAYQLLALLYIRRRAYSRAERILMRALRYDAYNPDTLKYLNELRVINVRRKKKNTDEEQWNWEEEAFRHISGDDVIGPGGIGGLHFTGSSVVFFIAGAIAAAIICVSAVLPSKTASLNERYNNLTVSSTEQINVWKSTVENLQAEVDDLEKKISETEKNAGDNDILSERISEYTELLNVLHYVIEGDTAAACLHLVNIDTSQMEEQDTFFMSVYEEQYASLGAGALDTLLNSGQSLYESGEYESSAEFLTAALKVDSESTAAMYLLIKDYEELRNTELAEEWTQKLLTDYPDSAEAQTLDGEAQAETSGEEE